jgi:cellulose synthase/poly-beta-1,6-N-acetylglucosamine synthase-like glycosyltransferase
MAFVIWTISLGALAIALGEYVAYNLIILAAGLARPKKPAKEFVSPLSIIIPVYNEERHIRRKLENIFRSDYPPELLEVIVVDDGSSDRTSQIVREFMPRGLLLIEMAERKGKISAQKEGFARATAPIAVITDATVLAPPDALRKLAGHFQDPRIGAVSAAIVVRNQNVNYLTRVAQFLFDVQNAQKLGESSLDSAGGMYGQLSLVRREALGDFGTDVVYEDREFGIALRRRGFRVLLEPSVQASYHAPESLQDFSRQKQRNIGAITQSIFRHRQLLFNPKYGWYGMLIFPEYSLFRVLRAYLLLIGFCGLLISSLVMEPASAVPLLFTAGFLTLACYVAGTAALAPLVKEPWRFLVNVLISIPAMALVALHLATASLRYFRGDFDALWERVKRDRAV